MFLRLSIIVLLFSRLNHNALGFLSINLKTKYSGRSSSPLRENDISSFLYQKRASFAPTDESSLSYSSVQRDSERMNQNDDNDSILGIKKKHQGKQSYIGKDDEELPTWLYHFHGLKKNENPRDDLNKGESFGNVDGGDGTRPMEETEKIALKNLLALKTTLERYCYDENTEFSSQDQDQDQQYTLFDKKDVQDILNSVVFAGRDDWLKISGAAEFLMLMLSFHEERGGKVRRFQKESLYGENNEYDFSVDDGELYDEPLDLSHLFPFLTNGTVTSYEEEPSRTLYFDRDMLIASAFHYCDCVEARQNGLYSMTKKAVKTSALSDASTLLEGDDVSEWNVSEWNDSNLSIKKYRERDIASIGDQRDRYFESNDVSSTASSSFDLIEIEKYGQIPFQIATNAAKIKRMEVLYDSVVEGGYDLQANIDGERKKQNSQVLRNLLISSSADLRALAIRTVASLYRLRGILQYKNMFGSVGGYTGTGGTSQSGLTRQEKHAFQEALYVYAPLAGRLGMRRLKAALENTSFRTLYPRQYASVIQSYYPKTRANGAWEMNGQDLMSMVVAHITQILEENLFEDEILMHQLESVELTSRLKEPYSMWKKMLKIRVEQIKDSKKENASNTENTRIVLIKEIGANIDGKTSKVSQEPRDPPMQEEETSTSLRSSFANIKVPDTIALRIIIKARKLYSGEGDHVTVQREKLLCYYIQDLFTNIWPPSDISKMKDYINSPKPNGYQSLHYTTGVFRYGEYWPFELQIRSRAMHDLAEYGNAAHWSYKIEEKPLLHSSKDARVLKHSRKLGATVVGPTQSSSDGILIRNKKNGEESNPMLLYPSSSVSSLYMESNRRDNNPYMEALSIARTDLIQNSIFIFMSPTSECMEGKVIPMPSGSTVSDALNEFEMRFDVGNILDEEDLSNWGSDSATTTRDDSSNMDWFLHRYRGLTLNGLKVNSDRLLSNGDVLTVPTERM